MIKTLHLKTFQAEGSESTCLCIRYCEKNKMLQRNGVFAVVRSKKRNLHHSNNKSAQRLRLWLVL